MSDEKPIGRPLTQEEKQAALEADRGARAGKPEAVPEDDVEPPQGAGGRWTIGGPSDESPPPAAQPEGDEATQEAGSPARPPDDGAGRIRDLADHAEVSADCPIKVLGHNNGDIYYFSAAQEFRVLPATRHTPRAIEQLFGGKLDWPIDAFPNLKGRGPDYDLDALCPWLFDQADEAGLFDPNTPVRGPGVWRGPGDEIIVHAGDALWRDGEWIKPGLKLDDCLYAAAARVERPALEISTVKDGRKLLEGIGLWRFQSDLGPEIILGFLGAAMLGGAHHWRVHQLTIGKPGSGKSWLSDLVTAALGGGGMAANNVTEAALRQAFTNQARAMVLDEQEGDEQTAARIRAVIQLLRLMSSGAGAKTMRGTVGGQAQSFTVTGSAYLAAVLPPVLQPQDRTRISIVRLSRLPTGEGAEGGHDAALEAIAFARAASPALRARAIAGWGRFRETFKAYRNGFLKQGLDPRDCDRIGTLIAGRDLLTCDDLPDTENVMTECDRFLELVSDAAAAEEDSEGHQCLNQLLTWPVDVWRSGQRDTIAEIVLKATESYTDAAEARAQLQKFGLRLKDWETGRRTRLFVANRHVGLDRIFANTRWEGGRWAEALRYLPDSATSEQPERFAGVRVRATVIAARWLPERDPEDTQPLAPPLPPGVRDM